MNEEQPRVGSVVEAADLKNAYFLGAYGENNELLESVFLEFLRDHVYWRRNIHPDDPVPISTLYQYQPEYLRLVAKMKQELHRLSADLKHSVPFFNPRYIGHMASDLILPGLLAELITTFYNPNNVSEEAAPVTLRHEMAVAKQLARMIGFNTDPGREPCAWGHLTSGGTIANFEALWYLRAVRFYPLAMKTGLEKLRPDVVWPEGLQKLLDTDDEWQLMNQSVEAVIQLKRMLTSTLAGKDRELAQACIDSVESERIEHLGVAEFFRRHAGCKPPVVCVPVTAHYSWKKAMRVLGLGSAQLVSVPADVEMRMDIGSLEQVLATAAQEQTPVLAVVGVLGTTEFGSVDPIDRIVKLRNTCRDEGLEFGVHVDAAWGGYLLSMFREADGSFSSPEQARKGLFYFPSDASYAAFKAMSEVDSVTVDPHKLGYLPFGIGGIVLRNGEVPDFVSQEAAYVFAEEHDMAGERLSGTGHYRHLGKFIMEGSKPGSSAAAAYITHRVLPLDRENFGQLIRSTIRVAEYFYERIHLLSEKVSASAKITVPFLPGTNLVCVAINPAGNGSAAVMNKFMRRIYAYLSVHPDEPIQEQEYFGSQTAVMRANLTDKEAVKVALQLGLDPDTYTATISNPRRDADSLVLLRHTLMNPWLMDSKDGDNYIDRYCEYLEALIVKELAQKDAW